MLLALSGCRIVEPGHVGVQVFLGNLNDTVLDPGLSIPNIRTVINVSTQNQTYGLEYTSSNPNAAVSSDMQTVGFSINLAYYITGPEAARNLVEYVNRNPDTWVTMIIDPAINQGVKVVFSRFTLREIIEKREVVRREVSDAITELINERLEERSPDLAGAIRITQVTLNNLDYSREFEAVIEATQREEQRARLAQNELARIRIEAEQQIVQASAERRANVERARGQAESLLIATEARVQSYYALQAAGINPNSYRFTEVWDGKLPTVMSGEGGLDFLISPGQGNTGNISAILEDIRVARYAYGEETAAGDIGRSPVGALEELTTEPLPPTTTE